MYKNLLVPLDGSSAAEITLPYAEEIATKGGADIFIVSVSESGAVDIDHLYRPYLKQITEQVQNELKSRGTDKKVNVHSEVLIGKPADEILRYVDENNVDLITMASCGSSGRGPWILGSIATKVLQATAKPVLLIRAPASSTAITQREFVKKTLVPLDGSKVGETAITNARTLAEVFGAELILLQVIEPVTEPKGGISALIPREDEEQKKAKALSYLDGIGKRLKKKGVSTPKSVAVFGSPAAKIIEYAKANAVDLIAMSTHGRSGVGRWVFGSVTEKVLHAGDTAVLIVRATKA